MTPSVHANQPSPGSESTPAGRRPNEKRTHRVAVNITPPERIARIMLGLLGAIAGAVLLASAGSAWVIGLEVLLVLAGLDLVVTGALGHCPLYQKLGYVPQSLRSPT